MTKSQKCPTSKHEKLKSRSWTTSKHIIEILIPEYSRIPEINSRICSLKLVQKTQYLSPGKVSMGYFYV